MFLGLSFEKVRKRRKNGSLVSGHWNLKAITPVAEAVSDCFMFYVSVRLQLKKDPRRYESVLMSP